MLQASGVGDTVMPAKSPAKLPKWSAQARRVRDHRSRTFTEVLSDVATDLARHANLDSVSVPHVDEAYRAIARCGLSRTPWYRSSEFATSLGALLVGCSFSSFGLLTKLLPESLSQWAWPIFAVTFVIGAAILLLGWKSRLSLPQPPVAFNRWKRCWPFLQCPRTD